MGSSILTATDLSKVVASAEGELTILHELSLELNKGDSLAIVGASGSGKSTLLGLLAGLDLPSSGEVTLAGQALSALDEDQRRGSAPSMSVSSSSHSSCSTASMHWKTSCCRWSWTAARMPANAPRNCCSASAWASA